MGMMNSGMAEAANRTPMAGMGDQDGDNDVMVTCPSCGTSFAPGDTDGDAAQLQAGAPPAGAQPTTDAGAPPNPTDLASPSAPPAIMPQSGGTCPECGGKMDGGQCASCGYSEGHSPMQSAIAKHVGSQPEHARPDAKKVYEQGIHAREHMRRSSPYGRP